MSKGSEKMDINELNSWLLTDEGKQWGDQFKAPLLNKRDELLSQIKDSNAKLTEWDQRSAAYENSLSEEKAIVEKFVVDKELQSLLEKAFVFEGLIPNVIQSLKNAYGITVKASGGDRKASGMIKDNDGNEKEIDLAAIVDNWKQKPENKAMQACTSTGGGATGSFSITPTKQEINPNSGRQLVNTSDQDFNLWRQKELEKSKGTNL
jgi:hypothetical protein